jgi:allantoate deiminase
MKMTTEERAERAVARCRELARVTDVEGETTRTFLSPAMQRANEMVAGWMMRAGMALRLDAAGNVRGTLGSVRSEDAPRFVMGSHLDTVVNAGAFDGPLGVALAIEAAESFGPRGLPYVLEVIAFSEEEGVRFGVPFLGSRAVVGRLDEATLGIKDQAGVTVAEAMREFGLDVEGLEEARLAKGAFGYLEVHLEQGPMLEQEGRAIAGVSAIAGQTRLAVRFEGRANHAGTTPMGMRRDALVAASEWVVEVERLAEAGPGERSARGGGGGAGCSAREGRGT